MDNLSRQSARNSEFDESVDSLSTRSSMMIGLNLLPSNGGPEISRGAIAGRGLGAQISWGSVQVGAAINNAGRARRTWCKAVRTFFEKTRIGWM